MGKRKPPEQPGVPEWVLTYGDLMSLLLCFFILLAAFSEIKQPREYRKVIDAIKEALGSSGGIGLSKINENVENSIISQLEELAKRDDQSKNTNQTPIPNISGRNPRASVIHQSGPTAIGSSIPFEPGEFHLTASMQKKLKFDIAPMIRDQKYIVHITGHAWGETDKARSGMSSAELSFKRAESVQEYLIRDCEVSPQILRILVAADQEPMSAALDVGDTSMANRRVQLYQTGQTVEQLHPDPNFTGRGG
jgi:chemotaxis protein MotB